MKRERYLLLPVFLMVSVALSLWATISLAQLADTPWPMFGHDLQHTGRSPYLGAQTDGLKWRFLTGDMIHSSSPAIGSDGTIYVGSGDRYLYAINPDGTEKWRFLTGANIDSSPAIGSDGTIYVGSFDRYLYAINPDGTEKWRFLTIDRIYLSTPAIGSDGTIYVGSLDGYLYAINPDGTEKWKFLTGDEIHSSPAIGSDGTIYVGSDDNYFYAVNPDGSMKWKFLILPTMPSWVPAVSTPAIGSDGTIYVGSWNAYLYAMNPDGSFKWRFLTEGNIVISPAIGSDGTIYVGAYGNYLYAINPDGSLKWKFLTDDGIFASPAIGSDGTIYVGTYSGDFYAINSNGTAKWKFLIDGPGIYGSSPAIGSDGTIYVGSEDGYLYAIGKAGISLTSPNGGEIWKVGTTHTISWVYQENPGPDVKIELLKGGTLVDTITSSTPIGSGGNGSYDWTIPSNQTAATDYQVRVTSTTNNSYTDASDGNFTITNPCPLETLTKDQSKLNLYRQFRDKTLSQTETGQEYTTLYYQHSLEVTSLLLKDSRLRSQATRLLDRATPEIRLILGGKANDLSPALKTSILRFLKNISQKGSPELKTDTERLMTDIEEGRTKEILGGIDPLASSLLPKNLALFSLLWPLGVPLAFAAVRRIKRR